MKSLEEFLNSLSAQAIDHKSEIAGKMYHVMSNEIEIGKFSCKVDFHSHLTRLGLDPGSTLFNSIWGKHHQSFPLFKRPE